MAQIAEKDLQQVVVRMPSALHAAIKERADQDERSMAQTIRHALRLYLRSGDER